MGTASRWFSPSVRNARSIQTPKESKMLKPENPDTNFITLSPWRRRKGCVIWGIYWLGGGLVLWPLSPVSREGWKSFVSIDKQGGIGCSIKSFKQRSWLTLPTFMRSPKTCKQPMDTASCCCGFRLSWFASVLLYGESWVGVQTEMLVCFTACQDVRPWHGTDSGAATAVLVCFIQHIRITISFNCWVCLHKQYHLTPPKSTLSVQGIVLTEKLRLIQKCWIPEVFTSLKKKTVCRVFF